MSTNHGSRSAEIALVTAYSSRCGSSYAILTSYVSLSMNSLRYRWLCPSFLPSLDDNITVWGRTDVWGRWGDDVIFIRVAIIILVVVLQSRYFRFGFDQTEDRWDRYQIVMKIYQTFTITLYLADTSAPKSLTWSLLSHNLLTQEIALLLEIFYYFLLPLDPGFKELHFGNWSLKTREQDTKNIIIWQY